MAPVTVDYDIDNFDVDDFNDPFASDDDNTSNKAQSKKRDAEASGLGIDEAIAVHKKPRAPNVKLDEHRLLSDNGIPKLRKKAGELKFKGKGHEFSDTKQLLDLYQFWLDDLFPKGKFLDSLAMIEKTGHKSRVISARLNWINELKPKATQDSDEEPEEESNPFEERQPAKFPARVAPIFQNQVRASQRPKTPDKEDLFGDPDEDIYDATPRNTTTTAAAGGSLFGNGAIGGGEPDEEDLDALMAEEEAQRTSTTSIFGSGRPAPKPAPRQQAPDDDDLDALMAEAEAESSMQEYTQAKGPKPSKPAVEDEDELDALMAEAEAMDAGTRAVSTNLPRRDKQPAADTTFNADDEEAMAEMDGLW
ncbi:replication fork protection component Swi3-domain-containing protein [Pseudomassariella vexata]|uniref:Chromosome segregation in meiosis protein n=1 Tax=Pseudomassariella vexata TaxID=1141098 RepID=A0A1Y2E7Q8_9PEZI|nr:replication fork protection component Swi3-domain-containing protein [Pseudomassariella vexata]ORY67591.1 replication fork protection component Swi3-domain-containing protein [Pseudomassariella vexata]